jgi:hypothetical protein
VSAHSSAAFMGRAGQALHFRPSRSPWLPMERLDRNSLAAVLRPLGSAHRVLVSGAVALHSGRKSANASGVLAARAEDASRP